MIESYSQLYFVYIIQSSLLISNYSIRVDNILEDSGNFPLWNTTFFPPRTVETGRHAHILDFDILRLGRKVLECNPNAGSGCSNGFLRIVGTYPDLRKGKTYYNMGVSSFEMVPRCTNLPGAVQSIGFCHIRLAGCLIFTHRLGFGDNSIYCNTSCHVGS